MKKIIFLLIIIGGWLLLHTAILLTVGLNDKIAKSDVILVFGNKVETSGIPSKRLQSRLDKSVELYQQNLAPLVVVSGGIGKEGYDEAEVMKTYLLGQGIPEEAVIKDSGGNDTYQTAKNLKEISKNKNITSVIIVSQYYHILRAKLAITKTGFNQVYTAHADMLPELRDVYSIPREIIGYYAYLFKDYSQD